jgi:glycosyltransferase involved in cell wall biosynthesis
MKLFEYLAAGKTILGTALPSIKEVLTHDHNAWLVPPDDPAALAAGMAALLSQPDLAKRLGQQAKQDAPRYTWPARARRILTALP